MGHACRDGVPHCGAPHPAQRLELLDATGADVGGAGVEDGGLVDAHQAPAVVVVVGLDTDHGSGRDVDLQVRGDLVLDGRVAETAVVPWPVAGSEAALVQDFR